MSSTRESFPANRDLPMRLTGILPTLEEDEFASDVQFTVGREELLYILESLAIENEESVMGSLRPASPTTNPDGFSACEGMEERWERG